ncbi:nucleoside 2-deoxyribosyltransferase [Variovorax paradoxus]|uniref:nucleoside 2-deoxyribosyltransferase n=1 Tax=Variovorax paradoxus TaxID=34073 RepID=UPI001932481A|nr:nucleoside 2-deoxyribosyltransferase [Variovorax paradoxus]
MNAPSDRVRRVYLAGPDVFRVDATARLQRLVKACAARGLEALPPAEDASGPATPPAEVAQAIYDTNMALLRRASGVIADLSPFRGTEPDSGTVFEVGVAIALGLPVVGYGIPEGSYAARVETALPTRRDGDGTLRDANGMAVEGFELPLNLMLACSIRIARTAEEALDLLQQRLG